MADMYRNPMFGRGLEAIAGAITGGDPTAQLKALAVGAQGRKFAAEAALDENRLGARQGLGTAFQGGGGLADLAPQVFAAAANDPEGFGKIIQSVLGSYSAMPGVRDGLTDDQFADVLIGTGTQTEGGTERGDIRAAETRLGQSRIAAGPGYARVGEARRQFDVEPLTVMDAVTGLPTTIRRGDFTPGAHIVLSPDDVKAAAGYKGLSGGIDTTSLQGSIDAGLAGAQGAANAIADNNVIGNAMFGDEVLPATPQAALEAGAAILPESLNVPDLGIVPGDGGGLVGRPRVAGTETGKLKLTDRDRAEIREEVDAIAAQSGASVPPGLKTQLMAEAERLMVEDGLTPFEAAAQALQRISVSEPTGGFLGIGQTPGEMSLNRGGDPVADAVARETAPASPAPAGPRAVGPNGEIIEWTGTEWVPVQ